MIFNPSLPEIDEANFTKHGWNKPYDDMKLKHCLNLKGKHIPNHR